ncbi:MAG TPA: sensor histidine kinase [Candidatus Binatia bacterium]|nr:sensor histidine kinase [Candidatus Binatia bacterium]
MTPQDQWLLQKERILAWLRVGFALVAVAVIQFNPSRVARFPLLSYISLGCFLIYSAAVLYIVVKQKTDSKTIGFLAPCLDMVAVSLIVFSTGGAATPFFAYYFFPIITASSRYGIKGGLSAGLAGVTIYGFIRFYFDWENLLGIDRFIVRSVYLVVLAYIFGFLSEFERNQNQKLYALSKTAGEVATLEERRRISRELHDGLLQSLATHILRLETCRKHLLEVPTELERELRSIENETRTSMKVIRQFLAGKETQAFPPGMLIEKLKEDLRFLRDGLGLQVIFGTDPEDLSVPEAIEQDLYYVLREGLMNISRHSQASQAEVVLRKSKTKLEGCLSDDGVGFELAKGKEDGRLGLTTMQERIKKLGGELNIQSSPGKGTRISFVLPVET